MLIIRYINKMKNNSKLKIIDIAIVDSNKTLKKYFASCVVTFSEAIGRCFFIGCNLSLGRSIKSLNIYMLDDII